MIPFFLVWGSFLNVVACRGLQSQSLLPRSQCPHCHHQLKWYHLIPLISWVFLWGRCHFCHCPISWLYPTIELLTAVALTGLCYIAPVTYFPAYFIFFSALLVTIRTDSEHQLILTAASLFLIPVGLVSSILGLLPIGFFESLIGTLLGSGILWITRTIFFRLRQQEGLGWGDVELMGMIGSFTGPWGVHIVLLLGALGGSLAGMSMILVKPAAHPKIPLGAFLGAAAIVFVLWKKQLLDVLYSPLF